MTDAPPPYQPDTGTMPDDQVGQPGSYENLSDPPPDTSGSSSDPSSSDEESSDASYVSGFTGFSGDFTGGPAPESDAGGVAESVDDILGDSEALRAGDLLD